MRVFLFWILLATTAGAQEIDVPDVSLLRDNPNFDLTATPSMSVQQAIAASEDVTFFETFHATSPITRQVVKNLLLSAERTMERRILELRLSIDLANEFSKDEIMALYAGRIFLGQLCYGFDAAFEHLLGVDPNNATLRDALTLASIIKYPSRPNDPARLTPRFEQVARAGQQAGFWDDATMQALIQAGPTPIDPSARCPFE